MRIASQYRNLELIQQKTPLVVHITNNVTINDCANVCLALGASPAMSVDPSDVAELASYASALVLNLGLVDALSLEAMLAAGKAARAKGVPIVLDPVAAGATSTRRAASQKLLEELRPEIVKGNGAEIKFLAGQASRQRGVDSLDDEGLAEATAILASRYGIVVAATGPEDFVSDGQRTFRINGGTPYLARVTGTGCMVSSLVGSFAAVERDYLVAAAQGIAAMKLAGERAAGALLPGEGTGHFHIRLIDALSLLAPGDFNDEGRYSDVTA
ncbi:MAG: Hydroxyethylthiazole kinase [Proteobacteria bacterium]|nr:Hydroxyethylthiazole kinase [Pseudomonadota bacterium]